LTVRTIQSRGRTAQRSIDPRIHVTPRTFKEVQQALRLHPRTLQQLMSARSLSIGEGLSNFARTLSDQGCRIVAVDPIFNPGGLDHAHPAVRGKTLDPAWAPRLQVAGDARSLGFADGVFDFVAMPFLLSWLLDAKKGSTLDPALEVSSGGLRALDEAVRVLAPGGEFRFNVWRHTASAPQLYDHYCAAVTRHLKTRRPRLNVRSYKPMESEMREGTLFVVKKTSPPKASTRQRLLSDHLVGRPTARAVDSTENAGAVTESGSDPLAERSQRPMLGHERLNHAAPDR